MRFGGNARDVIRDVRARLQGAGHVARGVAGVDEQGAAGPPDAGREGGHIDGSKRQLVGITAASEVALLRTKSGKPVQGTSPARRERRTA